VPDNISATNCLRELFPLVTDYNITGELCSFLFVNETLFCSLFNDFARVASILLTDHRI